MDRRETITIRLGSALPGLVLLSAAGLSAGLALGHMTRLETLCGSPDLAHCAWCYAAVAFALAGAAVLAFTGRPGPRSGVAVLRSDT
jgi:hypothetical protein